MTDSQTPRGPGDVAARRAPDPEHLDLPWVLSAIVDDEVVSRAVRDLSTAGGLPPHAEADRLLRAIRAIDLTTLEGDDTPQRVTDLCARARHPLPTPLPAGPALAGPDRRTASVCVYHHFLPVALQALRGTGIPVAVVAGGFPAGLSPLRLRIAEVEAAVDAGAGEVDVVINRAHALTGEWGMLYDELTAFRAAAGHALLKVILATGDLKTGTTIARASRVAMLAGADFIKTSTGKEAVNATPSAGFVMLREIAVYGERSGRSVGFKPAGGIRTAPQALEWMRMVEEVLGADALIPDRFRIGASSLLDTIVARLADLSGGPGQQTITKRGGGAGY